MLKNILKLEGVKKLSETQQKAVNGGQPYCINRFTDECFYPVSKICSKICGGDD
jgi:hypothetical protein